MRILAAGLLVLASGLAAGCGSSAKATADIRGGTATERSLALEILGHLAPAPMIRVRFRGRSPTGRWPGRRMDVLGPDRPADVWEQQLFADTYAFLAYDRRVPLGFVSTNEGAGGRTAMLDEAPRRPPSDAALSGYERKLRSAARAGHASIRVRELRPGPVALEVELTVADPARFLRHDLAPFARLWSQRPRNLFGALLEVEDETGRTAIAVGGLPAEGSVYLRPDLRGCTDLFSFSTPGRVYPPPCPAA